MNTTKKTIGNLGEDLACRFLKRKRFEIIERNYRKKWGEIDIIAKRDELIHFIEVKSVSRENLREVSHETGGFRPEDNVHPWKLQRLARTIQTYLSEKRIDSADWQFDVITAYIDTKNLVSRVTMLENIII
jgi:putative endonuclease